MMPLLFLMMMTKVLAERIEQNLEGMSKQLAKEVVGLEEVQKLQQVTNSNGHNLDDDVDGKECGWFEADPKEGKCKFMVRQNSGIEERRSGRRRWQEQRLRGKKRCNRGIKADVVQAMQVKQQCNQFVACLPSEAGKNINFVNVFSQACHNGGGRGSGCCDGGGDL